MPSTRFRNIVLASAAATLVGICSPVAAEPTKDLTELSLEDLLSSEVTSVAKRPQTVETSPAAIFVINREDIRRSGAATIPDLLRMVPGMEVAELSGGAVAVTARGFNGRYSNKLLVLVDGRPIYLSTLSGVLWDQQMVPVEDIQRIEVVRGPGATLWGANAVNGVVNIITVHPVDSLGSSAVTRADTADGRSASVRLGVAGDLGALRLYATGRRLPDYVGAARGGQVGFRYDLDATPTAALTLQGDLRSGRFREIPDETSEAANIQSDGRYSGADLLVRWTQTQSADRGYSVQAYWDRVKRKDTDAGVTRDQYDLEVSQHFTWRDRHAMIWGAGYRLNRDRVEASTLLYFQPERRTEHWYGAFIQDDVKLANDRVTVSLGTKIEHNDYTGVELEPSARVLVRLPAGSLWAAVSKAARTPSRFEVDSVPSFLGAVKAENAGSVGAEDLTAYELGWRGPVGTWASLDVAAFYNVYKNLLGREFIGDGMETVAARPPPRAPGEPPLEITTVNFGAARSYGIEAAVTAHPTERWTLKGYASWMELQSTGSGHADFQFYDLASSPQYQLSLRSWFDLTPEIDLDAWVRRVGSAKAMSAPVPAYTDLDLRLAWRPSPRVQVAVQGRNLLNKSRVEIGSAIPGVFGARIERAFELTLGFRY